jgi:glycosyltransferase involved in cell wall biosynthesis/2-polyprenyl-3-methyl-5-hydroxy-6-metoxy-1,4-benzoquinol methylase
MYDYKIDLSRENTSHTKILKLIDRDKYVLEIGCATGYMTRFLKEELSCRVVCVEIDRKAAEKAKPYCEELLIEDIESLDFGETLGDRRFDVVIMADILEHLKDPRSLLEKLRHLLTETGCILFSIPNGAHGSVALELLDGKWEYRSEGLLDRSHLRFFDKDSLSFLLDETGYIISQLDRVIIHPRDTEMKTPWDSYPRDVTAYIEKVNPEYQTYQFIVKAHPASVKGWKKGLEDALEFEKKKSSALEEKLESAEVNLVSLKGKLVGFEAEKAEIHRVYEAEKAEIHRVYEAEKAEIHRVYEAEQYRLNEYLTRLIQEKSELERTVARQEQLLNEIQSSLAWRLVTRYRRIIEWCFPTNTRRRRFYNLCLLAPVVLFKEGPLTFCRRIAVRIPVLKKVVQDRRPVRQPKKEWRPLSFPQFDKRERGFSKRVLVVDHYVPAFDVDAGSLRMFHLLRIFMELGYKVIFWPENRAYHERYTRELQRMGVETLYGDINFEEYLKTNGRYIDLILLSRPNIAVKFIDAARNLTNARIIYDTVDLHFVREERRARLETEKSARLEAEKSAKKWKSLELFLANQADETFVVSPVEKEILEREELEDRVSVISLVYSPESCCNSFKQREGLMFIGGFIHPPNEDGIVWFVESILPLIQQRLPGIHLHIVGSHPTDKIKSLVSTSVTVTGYVEDVSPYFEKARVFVSPLRYGAGIKGKIVQCMAYGLPVVTTPIGAEGMDSTDGYNMLIADDEEQFADKVVKAYQDRELWETLSLNSRTLFEQNYTPDAVKKALRRVLEKM